MTAKQKANQARFKKVVAEAKNLRKKNPKLTQAQAVKQAWAIFTGKKVGNMPVFNPYMPDVDYSKRIKKSAKKVTKKKPTTKTHKDTKSHNVNIKVVSGLPFEGRYMGVKLRAVLSSPNRIVIYAGNNVIYYYKGDNQLIIAEKLAAEIIKEQTTYQQLIDTDKKKILSSMKKFVATLKDEFPAGSVAKKTAKNKKTIVKKSTEKKQSGSSNIKYDRRIQALPPGKRKSASGRIYYESRANRSDKGKLLGVSKFDRIINQGINEFYVDKLKTLTDALAKAEKSKAIFDADWKTKDKKYKTENAIYKRHWPTRIKFLKKMISETKRHIK